MGYWRLVEACWTDEQEPAGKHAIYIEGLDARGGRVVSQPVVFEWPSGSLTLLVENQDFTVHTSFYLTFRWAQR